MSTYLFENGQNTFYYVLRSCIYLECLSFLIKYFIHYFEHVKLVSIFILTL